MLRVLAAGCALVLSCPMGAQTAWMQAVGSPDYDRLHDVEIAGGSLVVVGSRDEQFGASLGWLLTIDQNGAHGLDAAYVDAFGTPTVFTHVVPARVRSLPPRGERDRRLADGDRGGHVFQDRLFVGGVMGAPSLERDVVLMALEPDGDILWQRQLDLVGDVSLGELLVTRDGGILAVGTRLDLPDFRTDAWIMKVGPRGELQWMREVSTPAPDVLRTAVELPDGYLVAGQLGLRRSADDVQGWMMELDGHGEVVWQKGYSVTSSDTIHRVIPFAGGYLAVGSVLNDGFFRGDAWLLRTDSSGSVTGSRALGDFQVPDHDEIVDVLPTASGGYVVLGNTTTVAGPFEQMWAGGVQRLGPADLGAALRRQPLRLRIRSHRRRRRFRGRGLDPAPVDHSQRVRDEDRLGGLGLLELHSQQRLAVQHPPCTGRGGRGGASRRAPRHPPVPGRADASGRVDRHHGPLQLRLLMTVSTRSLVVLLALCAASVLASCQGAAAPASKVESYLCGSCGVLKGMPDCCDAEASRCSSCGLIAGSPGCCKMAKGTDAWLCLNCGEIDGGEACCREEAPRCDSCQLIASSPGCCKI